MPIDDKLEELEEGEENRQEKKKIEKNPKVAKLYTEAREILGAYLADDLFSGLKYKSLQVFLKTLGPFVLGIRPASLDSKKQQECIFAEIDVETFEECLKTFGAEYLIEDDEGLEENKEEDNNATFGTQLEEEDSLEDYLKSWIPEYEAVMSILCGTIPKVNLSPYAIVMGMAPGNRALMAVAVKKAIDNNEINMYRTQQKIPLLYRIISSVPSLKRVAEVAKEYNVDAGDAIKDLNEIVRMYKDEWG